MSGRPPPKKRPEESAPTAQIVPLRPRNQLVPFGKYKGQPVEMLLADRNYCDWIQAQPGFRERYPVVYNIIVSGPSEEQCTPAHNRLQNLFLLPRHPHAEKLGRLIFGGMSNPLANKEYEIRDDEGLLLRIEERKGEKHNWDVVLTVTHKWKMRYRAHCADDRPPEFRELKWEEKDWDDEELATLVANKTINPVWNIKSVPVHDTYIYRHTHYIKSYLWKHAHDCPPTPGRWETDLEFRDWDFLIELKPMLGDDYPAVLRKMVTRPGPSYRIEKTFLVVGSFHSEVTTLEDLKAIFAQHDIAVVTLSEIEAVK